MLKTTLTASFLFFVLISPALAQTEKTITLKDGSQIQGHIVSMDNGQYSIESQTLGKIQVPEENIVNIVTPGQNPALISQRASLPNMPNMQSMPSLPNNSSPEFAADVKTTQAQIMSNPAAMQEIQALAADPEIISLLSDPELLKAATSGNPQAIQSNPRIQMLMSNPKMQQLMQKLGSQQQQ